MHNVHQTHQGKFNTASGIIMDLNHPLEEHFNGWDIAKGLAYTARFGGQTTNFYSVAQHSVLVKYLAPAELKKAALLHDASEAYLGDVIKPLKVMLGRTYSEIEERFMAVIGVKFGVLRREFEAIKEFDIMALEMEHNAFQKGYTREWGEWWERNINSATNIWSPEYGLNQYLAHFKAIFGEEAIGRKEAIHAS